MTRLPTCLLLVAAMGVAIPAPARSIRITVINKRINAQAVYEHGRMLLPLRPTFEALNSTVNYDPVRRILVARNILHVVHLRLNSRTAMLDGRIISLEAAPTLHNGRVYVPLRFAAEAMGAIVRYDPEIGIVAVNGSDGARVGNLIASPPKELIPPPNSSVLTAYPVISASIGAALADKDSVRFAIDGISVSPASTFDGRTITFVPTAPLSPGRHTVEFAGRTTAGQVFSTQWSFISTPPSDSTETYEYAPYQFFKGPFQPYGSNSLMNLTVIGPPTGSGFVQVCNSSVIYPLWNGGGRRYNARLVLPRYAANNGCPITATFIDGRGHRNVLMATPTSGSLYLTGNPLFPLGQFSTGPIFVPVSVPHVHPY